MNTATPAQHPDRMPTLRLEGLSRAHYGHRVSFTPPEQHGGASQPLTGILREVWRENFENSVPGRCVAISEDATGKLTRHGPMPLNALITDLGAAAATNAGAQRPDWVPARIETLSVRWIDGPKHGTGQTLEPERMRRRFVSSVSGTREKAEYVWDEQFVSEGTRAYSTSFWFAGWIHPEETQTATDPTATLTRGSTYRIQFRNGPLVHDLNRFHQATHGTPDSVITLQPSETGHQLPITYVYTGFGAASVAGFRASYRHHQP